MKTIYVTAIVFLLLIFSQCPQGFSQNQNLRFDHIGLEEGLSNENVTSIFQDSKGYIWIGTADGLNKFDGYTFTKYKFDPLDSNSISQNFIYTIFEDKYGVIWVSSFEGLCRFDPATEKFTRYKPSPKVRFADPNISAISEDREGMIWVGSYSGGLCRFDRKEEKFLPEYFDLGYIKLPGKQISGLNHFIFCIYKDKAGTLWVGSTTGLHRINLSAAKSGQPSAVSFTDYQHDSTNPNSISDNLVTSVFEDRAGIIWAATNNGLNSLDKRTGNFTRYKNDPKNVQTISYNNLSSWGGSGIKEDQQGNLWISTEKGLNKLNKDRSVFTHYFHKPNESHSISNDIIYNLEIDREGILWAGSFAGKLNKVNLNHKGFELRRNDPNNMNSLSNNEVTSIVEDSSGIIWIGTYRGGLNRWDRRTNEFTHFKSNPANPETLKYDMVNAILEDRRGNIWVCNGHVLSRLNKQTGKFNHFDDNEKYLNDSRGALIYSITEDRQGLIWLSTNNGIKCFDPKEGKFIKHYYHSKTDSAGISDYTAITIFADSKDNIWVGYGSIATDRLNKGTGHITHYKHNSGDTASISSNIVNSFREDSKGNIWMGTSAGGLCYFDYKTEKFITFTDKHGLSDNTLYSIVEDNNRHLWLGTQIGLSQFDPVTKVFTNYDYKDGLQSNVFAAGERNRGAHLKGKDGTLYFGGNNGVTFFDPFKINKNSTIAPVVITQFKLFDRLVKGANELKEIILDHDENYFSFEFSSLSFNNPAKNQYAYQLEGVDENWVNSGARRYAGYTNIEPGRYTFKVKGTNSDGVWNEKGTSISITINPPWWRTWWAYTLFALLFAAFIYSLFQYRLNKIRMQHEIIVQQHKVSKLRTESQQGLLNERLRISRDLHDDIGSTLGSISIYSEVAKKRTEKKENSDEVLTKIGIVSRELIDKMSDIVWSLNPNNESFEQLQNRIITFATMMLTPQNIKYDFSADNRSKELNFTSEQRKNIFLIFKEAVHNIVKYAACETVNITMCVKNNHFTMAIKDDGKGFDAAANIVVNLSSNTPSLGRIGGAGIKNMNARASGMNAKLSINSKINEGTTVQFTLNV